MNLHADTTTRRLIEDALAILRDKYIFPGQGSGSGARDRSAPGRWGVRQSGRGDAGRPGDRAALRDLR